MSNHSSNEEEEVEVSPLRINWNAAELRGLDGLLASVREEQNQQLNAAGLGECSNFVDAVKVLYQRSLGADELEVSSNFYYS